MKTFVFAIMISAGIVTSGYAADKNIDITTFTAEGVSDINVRTISGNIYIDVQKRTDILVEQLPDNKTACDVTMEVSSGTLLLKALERDGVQHKRIKTGFKVHLPSGLPVMADTVSGDIKAADLTSPVNVTAISGNIRLANITGPVDVETTSGDIRLARVMAPIVAKTTSGDISATFPKSTQVAADVSTTSGKVRNDFSGTTGFSVTAKNISGNISLIGTDK